MTTTLWQIDQTRRVVYLLSAVYKSSAMLDERIANCEARMNHTRKLSRATCSLRVDHVLGWLYDSLDCLTRVEGAAFRHLSKVTDLARDLMGGSAKDSLMRDDNIRACLLEMNNADLRCRTMVKMRAAHTIYYRDCIASCILYSASQKNAQEEEEEQPARVHGDFYKDCIASCILDSASPNNMRGEREKNE